MQARVITGAVVAVLLAAGAADAHIFNWMTGEVIPGTESITPGPGLHLYGPPAPRLSYAALNDMDLHGASLCEVTLDNADFSGSNLRGATLGTDIEGSFSGADFSNADLTGVYAYTVNFSNANFSNAVLSTCFERCSFDGSTILVNADFRGSSFNYGHLVNADFSDVDLRGVRFDHTDVTGTIFSGARIEGARFVTSQSYSQVTREQIYSTISYQQKNLTGIQLDRYNVSGWDFSGQNLASAQFFDCRFTDANFTDANISGALFWAIGQGLGLTAEQLCSTANYKAHDLRNIHIYFGLLQGCDLSGQDLRNSGLNESRLDGANLRDSNLTGAHFDDTDLTGADLTNAEILGALLRAQGLAKEQLYSTRSWRNKNLSGVSLYVSDMIGWDLSGVNLTGASLGGNLTGADMRGSNLTNASLQGCNLSGVLLNSAVLAGTDLSDAEISGANLNGAASLGLTRQQLFSTKSYRDKHLVGVDLSGNDLTGADLPGARLDGTVLVGSNLSGSDLRSAVLSGADLSGASLRDVDLREAIGFEPSTSDTRNAILPDGSIVGLTLDPSEVLVVRDSAVGVTVLSGLSMSQGATLKLVFSDTTWGSTISVDDGLVPVLGGTLELDLTSPPRLVRGTVLHLFAWPEGMPEGEHFANVIVDTPSWLDLELDLSRLYSTGDITVTATPEPATLALLALGGLAVMKRRRRYVMPPGVHPWNTKNRPAVGRLSCFTEWRAPPSC